ncbi:hypothetical protein [Nostoc sp.]
MSIFYLEVPNAIAFRVCISLPPATDAPTGQQAVAVLDVYRFRWS